MWYAINGRMTGGVAVAGLWQACDWRAHSHEDCHNHASKGEHASPGAGKKWRKRAGGEGGCGVWDTVRGDSRLASALT